jgi:hypothetical protein
MEFAQDMWWGSRKICGGVCAGYGVGFAQNIWWGWRRICDGVDAGYVVKELIVRQPKCLGYAMQGGIKYFTSLEDSLEFFKFSPETA